MRGYPKSLEQAGLWRAGGLVKLVEGGEVLVAEEELGGGVILLLWLMVVKVILAVVVEDQQIANKRQALAMVVVEGEQVAEAVVLLDVAVDKGEGWPSSETGVSPLITTLVFLMLTSSGGRPPSSTFVTAGR